MYQRDRGHEQQNTEHGVHKPRGEAAAQILRLALAGKSAGLQGGGQPPCLNLIVFRFRRAARMRGGVALHESADRLKLLIKNARRVLPA